MANINTNSVKNACLEIAKFYIIKYIKQRKTTTIDKYSDWFRTNYDNCGELNLIQPAFEPVFKKYLAGLNDIAIYEQVLIFNCSYIVLLDNGGQFPKKKNNIDIFLFIIEHTRDIFNKALLIRIKNSHTTYLKTAGLSNHDFLKIYEMMILTIASISDETEIEKYKNSYYKYHFDELKNRIKMCGKCLLRKENMKIFKSLICFLWAISDIEFIKNDILEILQLFSTHVLDKYVNSNNNLKQCDDADENLKQSEII